MCCYHSFPRPWQTFGITLTTCIWEWHASYNNLRGTPRGSRKKPKAGRQPTGPLSTDMLCRGLEKNGMVGAWHGYGMGIAWQVWIPTRPHCVNQMWKTHSKPFAAGHGRGTACYVWIGLLYLVCPDLLCAVDETFTGYGRVSSGPHYNLHYLFTRIFGLRRKIYCYPLQQTQSYSHNRNQS